MGSRKSISSVGPSGRSSRSTETDQPDGTTTSNRTKGPDRSAPSNRPSRITWLVAVGDVGAIVLFVSFGLLTHGVHPLQFPWHTAVTSLPFVLGWLCFAPIGGLYRRRTMVSLRSTILRTTGVWTGAILVGGFLRSRSFLPGGTPPEFLLVVFVFGLGAVLPWRLVVSLTEHVRHNREG